MVDFRNNYIVGNALDVLKSFPDDSIDSGMTSPPYYAVRDYGEENATVWGENPNCDHRWMTYESVLLHENRNFFRGTQEEVRGARKRVHIHKYDNSHYKYCEKCSAWFGQLGMEPVLSMYVDHLTSILHEVKRVLKPWGVFWLNIDDSFGGGRSTVRKRVDGNEEVFGRLKKRAEAEIITKSLLMIPEKIALAMIKDGWILRAKVIWLKPYAMSESVLDRPRRMWEYLYMFVKNPIYWFDIDKIGYRMRSQQTIDTMRLIGETKDVKNVVNIKKKYPSDAWVIRAETDSEHIAPYPKDLCLNPIATSCPTKVCSECGKPKQRKPKSKIVPQCKCKNKPFIKGLVVDPFAGSGTTLLSAKKLGLDYAGIDIDEENKRMFEKQQSKVTNSIHKYF